MRLTLLLAVLMSAVVSAVSQVSLMTPLNPDSIKEWHFHVYFKCSNVNSTHQAQQLRDQLLQAVRAGEFMAVFPGITADLVPRPVLDKVPRFNTAPIGPHISGSYEVWVPVESLARALSWFTLNRGDLSILIHPLTRWEVEDHTSRSMWLGQPYPLDLTPLSQDLGSTPLQYPELHLGYSAHQ